MAGAGGVHNIIATNLAGQLYNQLRGKPCLSFGSDMKVRLQNLGGAYFYYPDAMVTCDPSEPVKQEWRERPTVLFEILSESTRRIDEGEKRLSYHMIPSLQEYVRIEQEIQEVVVERRSAGWVPEKLTGLDAVLELPSIGVRIPLAELYERLKF